MQYERYSVLFVVEFLYLVSINRELSIIEGLIIKCIAEKD